MPWLVLPHYLSGMGSAVADIQGCNPYGDDKRLIENRWIDNHPGMTSSKFEGENSIHGNARRAGPASGGFKELYINGEVLQLRRCVRESGEVFVRMCTSHTVLGIITMSALASVQQVRSEKLQ